MEIKLTKGAQTVISRLSPAREEDLEEYIDLASTDPLMVELERAFGLEDFKKKHDSPIIRKNLNAIVNELIINDAAEATLDETGYKRDPKRAAEYAKIAPSLAESIVGNLAQRTSKELLSLLDRAALVEAVGDTALALAGIHGTIWAPTNAQTVLRGARKTNLDRAVQAFQTRCSDPLIITAWQAKKAQPN